MNVCVVGMGGEIASNLFQRLRADGWGSWKPWDLVILGRGTMEPIGKFFDTTRHDWMVGVVSNGVGPLGALRELWSDMAPGGQVVFLGGPNQGKACETYSAYKCGKAILEAIVPTLRAEYPGYGFHVLNPGVVLTKIHQQTLRAGERAANLDRVLRIVSGEEKTVTHDEVYEKLKALIGVKEEACA